MSAIKGRRQYQSARRRFEEKLECCCEGGKGELPRAAGGKRESREGRSKESRRGGVREGVRSYVGGSKNESMPFFTHQARVQRSRDDQ